MKLSRSLFPLLFYLSACAADNNVIDAKLTASESSLSQPVYYGSSTPTLYTGMPDEQQNALVSLCQNYGSYTHCFCSGTLISPHVVLTAAHCLVGPGGKKSVAELEVRIGAENHAQGVKKYAAAEAIYYADNGEDYSTSYDAKLDIAVVILKEAVSGVTPIKIQDEYRYLDKELVQAGGFGITQDSNEALLRNWTTMQIIGYTSFEQYVLHSPVGQTSGVASGDSGSGLYYDFGNGLRVIGVASTSADGWVGIAHYTSVAYHAKWVQKYIYAYDDNSCQAACQNVACGQVGSCSCGFCPSGYECNAAHKCQLPEVTKLNGFCWGGDYTNYKSCTSHDDCTEDEFCFDPYEDGISRCWKTCQHQACLSDDPYSIYMPVQLMYEDVLMFEYICSPSQYSVPAACEGGPETEGTDCLTASNTIGVCFNNICYPYYYYQNNRCDQSLSCYPENICRSLCKEKYCGTYHGCDCGQCKNDKVCDEKVYICVKPEYLPEPETTDVPDAPLDAPSLPENDVTEDNNDRAAKKGCNAVGNLNGWLFLALALFLLKKRQGGVK